MVNRVVGDEGIVQNRECESGLDPQKVADGDFDEDCRPKRTGGKMYMVCGLVQYAIVTGSIVGFTLTASISMEAILKSDCYHKSGHHASCHFSHRPTLTMIGMGIFEIFVYQIPHIDHVWWLSIMATLTSLGYSFIGVGLALATIISEGDDRDIEKEGCEDGLGGNEVADGNLDDDGRPRRTGHGKRTTLTGIEVGPGLTAAQKLWRMFRAFGDMLICCSYSAVLIEIQDTLKSSKSEIKVMKKANMMTAPIITFFYLLCACFGYAAFGNNAHGNMLTGFGFFEPFWLIDLANIFIAMHLLGAYQVLAQPVFVAAESQMRRRWPKSKFITSEYPISIGKINLNLNINFFRLTWRTMFVAIATLLALALPFFNEVVAFLGAISYWPLTVCFPVNMYIAQNKISWKTIRWFGLQAMNLACFLLSLAAACGSIEGFGEALHIFKPK